MSFNHVLALSTVTFLRLGDEGTVQESVFRFPYPCATNTVQALARGWMNDTRGRVEMELLRRREQQAMAGNQKGREKLSFWPKSCRGSGEVEVEELDAPARFNEVEDGLAVRSLDDFFVCDAETGEPFHLEQLDDLKAAAEKETEKQKEKETEKGDDRAKGAAETTAISVTGAGAATGSTEGVGSGPANARETEGTSVAKKKKKKRIMAFGTLVLPLPPGLHVRLSSASVSCRPHKTYDSAARFPQLTVHQGCAPDSPASPHRAHGCSAGSASQRNRQMWCR